MILRKISSKSCTLLMVKVFLSVFFLLLTISKVSVTDLNKLFQQTNAVFLAFALSSFILSVLVGSTRSRYIIFKHGTNIPFAVNLLNYYKSLFYNLVVPGGIAGDLYRIFDLQKFGLRLSKRQLLMLTLYERTSGIWAMCVFITITFYITKNTFINPNYLCVLLILGTLLYLKAINWYSKLFIQAFIGLHFRSLISQGLQLMCLYSLLISQEYTGPSSNYLLCFLSSSIASYLPISIGGLGIREFIIIKLVNYIPIDVEIAIFVSISFFFIYSIVALNGFWFIFKNMPSNSKSD